jgi:SNF2 family DNA or RNA helicase
MSWVSELNRYIQACIQNQLTESSPQADQPAWIKPSLRPHQLSLLAAARELESHTGLRGVTLDAPRLVTRHGVLADRVGAGKSLVALSLVRDPPPSWSLVQIQEAGTSCVVSINHEPPFPSAAGGSGSGQDLSGADYLKSITVGVGGRRVLYPRAAIFVVPHNVVAQWETYIREQTNLRAVFVKKAKDCGEWAFGPEKAVEFQERVFKSDLVLVSCTMFRKFVTAIVQPDLAMSQIRWSRVFVDEADTIHVSLPHRGLSGCFTWFITGSWINMALPHGIRSYELAALPPATRELIGGGAVAGIAGAHTNLMNANMGETRDARFAARVLRNSADWIDTSLSRPVIVHEQLLCRAPANLRILQGHISGAAMEALHAGDVAGAMTALGLKAASKESLVERVTASIRGELIAAEKLLDFKRDMEYSSPAAKAQGIEKAEAKVAKIKAQLAALEERVAKAATELCPICYDTPTSATLTPCCRNAFCLACICECLSKKPACPLCRLPIASPKELMVLGDGAGAEEAAVVEEGPPTKGAALMRLLAAAKPDDRFLVFSAHEASFKGLRDMLDARGVRCELLSGTGARVEKLRKQFREGKVQVLCMNARHVGAGINLEAATHVVLYHRMNAELEKQVVGRAVRFERASELRVVHLVHEHETAMNGGLGSEVIVHV